ncbi:hypothetical protein P43SY_006034 [Pythium insidiosum]|uniref:Glycosyl transferase 48 domain-containing protein n=1 Tax=Pythium insidiosum TaxID=114742 RepID=A0AAD5M287_PYTIN|nr:hypothetical protein P43SY_006034 [Pythium insidiosum]
MTDRRRAGSNYFELDADRKRQWQRSGPLEDRSLSGRLSAMAILPPPSTSTQPSTGAMAMGLQGDFDDEVSVDFCCEVLYNKFGFQSGSVDNQREHALLLLANGKARSKSSDAPGKHVADLHKKLLSNYVEWCQFLGVQPLVTKTAAAKFIREGESCYVGRNMAPALSYQIKYITFWAVLWGLKAFISYFILVRPLMLPSLAIYEMKLTYGSNIVSFRNFGMIMALWLPVIFIFNYDTQIYFTTFQAILGGIQGVMMKTGEIHGIKEITKAFRAAPRLFDQKVVEEDGKNITILKYLVTIHPEEWENFLERVDVSTAEEAQNNYPMEIRLWASYRGQTLARTVQGMMLYEDAIKILHWLEIGSNPNKTAEQKQAQLEDMVRLKFSYICACQVYEAHRMGQFMDFFRLNSMYYSHTGFYFATWMTIVTTFVYMYSKVYIALAGVQQEMVLGMNETLIIKGNRQYGFDERVLTDLKAVMNTQFYIQADELRKTLLIPGIGLLSLSLGILLPTLAIYIYEISTKEMRGKTMLLLGTGFVSGTLMHAVFTYVNQPDVKDELKAIKVEETDDSAAGASKGSSYLVVNCVGIQLGGSLVSFFFIDKLDHKSILFGTLLPIALGAGVLGFNESSHFLDSSGDSSLYFNMIAMVTYFFIGLGTSSATWAGAVGMFTTKSRGSMSFVLFALFFVFPLGHAFMMTQPTMIEKEYIHLYVLAAVCVVTLVMLVTAATRKNGVLCSKRDAEAESEMLRRLREDNRTPATAARNRNLSRARARSNAPGYTMYQSPRNNSSRASRHL